MGAVLPFREGATARMLMSKLPPPPPTVPGKSLSEDLLLRVGQAYESATSWHRKFAPGIAASRPVEPVVTGA